MSDVKKFYAGLKSVEKDVFVQILQDMGSDSPQQKLDVLKEELKEVGRKINEVNRSRERLTNDKQKLQKIYDALCAFLHDTPKTDIMLKFLGMMLSSWIEGLCERIVEARPDALLEKKRKLRRRLGEMTQRIAIGEELQLILFGGQDG